jgi:hypothetical protein
MPKLFAAALLSILAVAGTARAEPLPMELVRVYDLFYGGETDPMKFVGGYRDKVLAGAEGTWTGVIPGFYPEGDLLAKACTLQPSVLKRVSPFSFTITNRPNKDPVTFTYVAMGGSTFSEQVNPVQLFTWLNILDKPELESARNNALMSNSGVVNLYRPYPDVLVMQTAARLPRVLVRCP